MTTTPDDSSSVFAAALENAPSGKFRSTSGNGLILVIALFSPGICASLLASDPTPQARAIQQAVTPAGNATPLVSQDDALAASVTDAWRFNAGYQWRQIGSLGWGRSSHVGLPRLVNRAGHSSSGPVIPSLGQGDHFYDDGYVRQDGGTAHTGTTQFWGYNNNSQYNNADFFIAYHATLNSSQSNTVASSSSRTGPGWSGELEGSGVFASLESPELYALAFKQGSVSLSLEGGYSFAENGISRFAGDVFQNLQHSITVIQLTNRGSITDNYRTNGVAVPGAPYAGTLTGGGAQINNAPNPLARTITPGTGAITTNRSSLTALLYSNAVESFHTDLHTFSFGPKFTADLDRVRLGCGMGLALNVAAWEANTQETLYASQNGGAARAIYEWNQHASGTEVMAGFYLETACQVSLSRNVALYLACRYDWSKGMGVGAGPSNLQFNPGGWSVLSGLTVSF